jgi:hypothetical protein
VSRTPELSFKELTPPLNLYSGGVSLAIPAEDPTTPELKVDIQLSISNELKM